MDYNQFHIYTQKEIDEHDHNETIRMYDEWQEELGRGITDGSAWTIYIYHLLGLLHHFIEHRINVKKRFLGAEREDLIEAGRLAIITKARDYNPRKTKPTSYFTRYIDQFTKEELDNRGMTQHYMGCYQKLERAAIEMGYSGIADEGLNLQILADYSGIPLTTIREVKKLREQQYVSLDTYEDNYSESDYMTPEKKILQKEQNEMLYNQFEKLNPFQQWLLQVMDMTAKPLSMIQIMQELKDPEIYERFEGYIGDPKHINQQFLKKQRSKALRVLRSNYTFRKYTAYVEPVYELEEIPQATVEDIEAAIAANILDLD